MALGPVQRFRVVPGLGHEAAAQGLEREGEVRLVTP